MARIAAWNQERMARKRGAATAPRLTQGRLKFLGLNLDYSVAKARRVLGYDPPYATTDGLAEAMAEHAPHAPSGAKPVGVS